MITINRTLFAVEFQNCERIDKASIVHGQRTFFEYEFVTYDDMLKIGAIPLEGNFEKIGMMSDDSLFFESEATDLQVVLRWGAEIGQNGNTYIILKKI